MSQTTLPNILHALKSEGWWLDSDRLTERQAPPAPRAPRAPRRPGLCPRPIAALGVLVVLADLLFWRAQAGLSLVLFAAAIFVLATCDIAPKRRLRPAILLLLSCLPVLDLVQALSLSFLLAGLAAALVWARLPGDNPRPVTALMTGLAWVAALPRGWRAPFTATFWNAARHTRFPLSNARPRGRAVLRDWAFPLGGALVFGGLILRANPLILQALDWDIDLLDLTERLLFWGGVALMLWPLLGRSLPEPMAIPTDLPQIDRRLGVNKRSLLRALVTFNIVIGLQTLTDLMILLGGADLPPGMTYAEFAHRGAYPLLATALLAAGVALIARPFLTEHPWIKPLMLIWLAQNMVLCLGAVLRLELYVQIYGLTYLRSHAFLWMGLVAALLGLAIWQVLAQRRNRWLIWRGLGLAIALLWGACFVNFAALIASYNLSPLRAEQADHGYLCALPDTAAAAILSRRQAAPASAPAALHNAPCPVRAPKISDWRGWGFRKSRVSAYVARKQQERQQ